MGTQCLCSDMCMTPCGVAPGGLQRFFAVTRFDECGAMQCTAAKGPAAATAGVPPCVDTLLQHLAFSSCAFADARDLAAMRPVPQWEAEQVCPLSFVASITLSLFSGKAEVLVCTLSQQSRTAGRAPCCCCLALGADDVIAANLLL